MSAVPEKSIYLVIGHGDEVLVGIEDEDPMEARPTVPANTEIVLFEHCGGRLPTIIDCPLMKLFMDTSNAGRSLLENPNLGLGASKIKNKIGLPPRVYRAGEKHPEINLTLQASWSKGKVLNKETYSIMKSGTYKYPLTTDNFPAFGNSNNYGISRPLTNADCKKFSAIYTKDDYKRIIPQAFEGSVFPEASSIRPKGPAFMVPSIYLSDFIKKMKEIDPNPSIFYIITCRALPKKAQNYLKYHSKSIKNIRALSPSRPPLAVNKEILKGFNELGLFQLNTTNVPGTNTVSPPNVAVINSVSAPKKKQTTTFNNETSQNKKKFSVVTNNTEKSFVQVTSLKKKTMKTKKAKKAKQALKRNETLRRNERKKRLPPTGNAN
jgi:hypothetical protein